MCPIDHVLHCPCAPLPMCPITHVPHPPRYPISIFNINHDTPLPTYDGDQKPLKMCMESVFEQFW